MIIKSAAGNNALPKPLIPVYLVLFVFIISCGVEDEKNEIVFPTDPSVYTKILNGSDLSVRRYYKDMSNNNLNLSFDIYGPVKVSKSWDYYGKNVSGNDSHPGELAGEAIRLMVTKYSSVNFSVYDNDIDGKVDSVIIIHDGPGEEVKTSITDLIWSHQWDLNSAYSLGDGAGPVYTDGVLFSVYTMQPEYTSSRGDSSMGVFAHEFGHVLGLPDLYDTSNQTYGVGNWSLMAHGAWRGPGGLNDGTTPAPLLAWERFKIGGASWITLTTLASETGKVIGDIETTKTAFKIVLDITPNEVQFLIVEGKQSSTSTQWYVPGPAPAGGLLITHIHEGVIDKYFDNPLILSDGNNVNAGDTRVHGVNILESDGTHLWLKSNTGTVSDLYTSGGLTNVNMYNGSYPTYLKASVSATTVDVNGIAGTLSPLSMTFNVVP